MKKWIAIIIGLLFLICLTVGIAVGQNSKPTYAKNAQVQKKLDSLSTVIRTLEANLDNANKAIKRKDGQLSNKDRQIKNLKTEVKGYKVIVRNHEATIDTLNAEWDNCLYNYHDALQQLERISYIIYSKGMLPIRKVNKIDAIIDKE